MTMPSGYAIHYPQHFVSAPPLPSVGLWDTLIGQFNHGLAKELSALAIGHGYSKGVTIP